MFKPTAWMRGGMAGVFLWAQVPGSYAAEKNFWENRRQHAERQRSESNGTLVANLPVPLRPTPFEAVPSALSRGLSKDGLLAAPARSRETAPSPAAAKAFGWLPSVVAPFGDIREVFVSPKPGAPFIIHLQDAHEVKEAQINLAGLVQSLKDARGGSLVGLEGAVGGFSLELYRAHPDPSVTRQIAESLMEMGYLSGPELAAVAAPAPPTLWGVEDAPLYKENIEAFEESERARRRVQTLTAKLSAASEEARDRVYSPALRTLDDRRTAFHAHRESLSAYVNYLWSATDLPKGVYENLRLLRNALVWEESMDFKRVERERLSLVERLAKELPRSALDFLVKQSLEYRAGSLSYGDYHRTLRRVCLENGIPLESYGQLSQYISYVLLTERIDRDGLLQELDQLERATENRLALTAEQKALVSVRRQLTLMDKLTAHGLTALEWRTYLLEKAQILQIPVLLESLLGRRVPGGEALNETTLASFENFCARALSRNGALVKNLLEKMRQDKTSSAVLVAGGFHTEGLAQLLRREGVSYAVVTPKISKVPEDIRPLDVFARNPLPLEQLLSGEIIHLAYPRLSQTNSRVVESASQGLIRQNTTRLLATALQRFLGQNLPDDQKAQLVEVLKNYGVPHQARATTLLGRPAMELAYQVGGKIQNFVLLSVPAGTPAPASPALASPLFQREIQGAQIYMYAKSSRLTAGAYLSQWRKALSPVASQAGALLGRGAEAARSAFLVLGQLVPRVLGFESQKDSVLAQRERDINIASISPEFAPPHTDINDQIRTLKEMGHSVFKFTSEGWSQEVAGFELTDSDRAVLDGAAKKTWLSQPGKEVSLLEGIEVHVVGLPVHPFLHVGPWGAQRAHAGGISTAGSKNPTKRIWIPRGLWETNREEALGYIYHEAVELNRWFEKAQELIREEHIRGGHPPKSEKKKRISGNETLPRIREWIGSHFEEAMVEQKKYHTEANRLFPVNGDELVPYSYFGHTLQRDVVLVAWEDKDYWKRGGLGDVIGEATPTMVATGQKVVKILPGHRNRSVVGEDTGQQVAVGPADDQVIFRIFKHVPREGETVYFLEDSREEDDPNRFFPGEYYLGTEENKLRESAYFSRAVVAALRALNIQPSAVNAHDWQTALVLPFLKADDETQNDGFFKQTGRLFTIHNMGRNLFSKNYFYILQGLGLPRGFGNFGPVEPLEFNDHLDLLKGALDARVSDFINTVSPQYMLETLTPEGGQGLHGVLATRARDYIGILNGLDRNFWNPRRSPLRKGSPYRLKPYAPSSAFEHKKINKQRLQKKLGLPVDTEAPLMEFTARATVQKGIHWVMETMEEILQNHPTAQFVFVGDLNKGEELSQSFVDWMGALEKDPRFQIEGKSRVKYLPFSGNAKLEFYLKAASDFTLAPSVYEPAGLADKKGMLLGSVAVVNATGGLRFVIDPTEDAGRSTGFKMKEPTAVAFQETLEEALTTYEKDPETYQQIQKRGMDAPRSWESVSLDYLDLDLAAQVKRSRINSLPNYVDAFSSSGHFIGEMPKNLDLRTLPLAHPEKVRTALNELKAWLAQKIDSPPDLGSEEENLKFEAQLNQYLRVAEELTDVGTFDSNELEKTYKTRGMGFGLPAQNGNSTARLGLSQDFFLEGSVLEKQRLAALFHEVVHVARAGEADAKEIHEDALRQYLILFNAVPAAEAKNLDLPALEKHPLNALGRDMRIAWLARTLRDENIHRLTESLKAVLDTPQQLIRYLLEADAALDVAVPLSEEEFSRRATELAHRMHVIEGSMPNEAGEVLARRRFKAERALKDWARPLSEVGPVEGMHPLLKTITLLSKEEEAKLVQTLQSALESDPALRSRPLLDAILLMTDPSPPSEWAQIQGLAYNRIYHSSAEGRPLWRGGLGPVQTFHSDAEADLLGSAVENVDIEMDYEYYRGADTQLHAMEDRLFSTPIAVDEAKTFFLDLPFHEDTLRLRVRMGRGPKGNPVYLIREIREGASKYTKTIYDYGSHDNPITKEDFNAFLGAATLAVIAHLEEIRHSAQGENWKPPVIHTNDAQTSMVNVLLDQVGNPGNTWASHLKKQYPFLGRLRRDALRVMTTHTYFNRQYVNKDASGRSAVAFMSGITNHDEQDRLFGRNNLLDYTSAALHTAQGRTAVTRKHAWDVMRDYNPEIHITGVTNGMSTEWATKYFYEILRGLHGDSVDAHRPEPGFIPLAKVEAKRRFFHSLISEQGTMDVNEFKRFQKVIPQNPAGNIDEGFLNRPTVGTVVRLVPEKFNVERAWTDKNIRALIQKGVNVVIMGAVQTTDSRSTSRQYQLGNLQAALDAEWQEGQGRFVFLPAFSSTLKQQALGALDILVLDSDEDTEANGYTEVPGSAYGALILAPPFFNGEGLLRGQGIPVNFDRPGEGNTLIPENITPGAYLKVLTQAVDLYQKDRGAFAAYQATSIRLSWILEARITGAAYLREFNRVYKETIPTGVTFKDSRILTSAQKVQGSSAPLSLRVFLRPGMDPKLLQAQAVLSKVDNWGGGWEKRQVIPLDFKEVQNTNEGTFAEFESDVSLAPGRYEWFGEAKSSLSLWTMAEGIYNGHNAKLEVPIASQRISHSALDPMLRAAVRGLDRLGMVNAARRLDQVRGGYNVALGPVFETIAYPFFLGAALFGPGPLMFLGFAFLPVVDVLMVLLFDVMLGRAPPARAFEGLGTRLIAAFVFAVPFAVDMLIQLSFGIYVPPLSFLNLWGEAVPITGAFLTSVVFHALANTIQKLFNPPASEINNDIPAGYSPAQTSDSKAKVIPPPIVTLEKSVAGGPAKSQLQFTEFVIGVEALRNKLDGGATAAQAERDELMSRLELTGDAQKSFVALGETLGQKHAADKTVNGTVAADIPSMLRAGTLMAIEKRDEISPRLRTSRVSVDFLNEFLNILVEAYHRGQGMVSAEERALAVWERNHRVGVEISAALWAGEGLSEKDKTVQKILGTLARVEKNKQGVLDLILPEGADPRGIASFLQRIGAGSIAGAHGVMKADVLENQKHSVEKFLSVSQNKQKDFISVELFLLDPNEWVVEDSVKGLVKLLILLAGDLAVDLTDRLGQEVQHLNIIRLNA